jgi:hypothetical protein
MNEAWLGGLAGGFGGLHDVLRAVIARKQQEARDAEGNEDRDMRRLAQVAALRTAGIVPASEAQATPFEIPNMTEGMGRVATPSMPVNLPASGRYTPVGSVGGKPFVQDGFRTPEAEERKKAALEEIKRRALQQQYAAVGMSEPQAALSVANPALADNFIPKQEQPRPTPAPQTIQTKDGIYQWDPEAKKWSRTGLEAPVPATTFSLMPDNSGNIVGINPRNPQQVVPTGVQAPARDVAGAAAKNEKLNEARAALDLLNDIENDVATSGTDVDPRSPRRASLASKYAQFQLKLKDAAKLGALSASDLDIMLNALNDPTAWTARAKVGGSKQAHRANVLAGAQAVKQTLQREINRLQSASTQPAATGKRLSADDAAKAKADPEFAAWLKAQGYQVP